MTARFGKLHANHRAIGAIAMRVLFFLVLAKSAIAVKEIVTAYRFGSGPEVDSYNLAFSMASWLPMAITSIITICFVPALIMAKKGSYYRKSICEINALVLTTSVFCFFVTMVMSYYSSRVISVGLSPKAQDLTSLGLAALAIFSSFLVLSGYLGVRLQVERKMAYTFLEAMPAVFIILFVAVGPLAHSGASLIVGTIVGGAVQLAALIYLMKRSGEPIGGLRWRRTSPMWKRLYASIGAMALAQVVFSTSIPLDQILAARLGNGMVAQLGYASRLIGLATGLGTIVVARAVLPTISEALGAGQRDVVRRQVQIWSLVLMVAGGLGSFAGWYCSDIIVAGVLQRGSFTTDDTQTVTWLLQLSFLQVPFYLGAIVGVQYLAAINRYDIVLLAAVVAIAVKFIVALALLDSLGISALPISTAAMYMTSFAINIYAGRTLGAKSN